jgi:hypothetical protein
MEGVMGGGEAKVLDLREFDRDFWKGYRNGWEMCER